MSNWMHRIASFAVRLYSQIFNTNYAILSHCSTYLDDGDFFHLWHSFVEASQRTGRQFPHLSGVVQLVLGILHSDVQFSYLGRDYDG